MSSPILTLCNLGARDVKFDGSFLKRPREESKTLLERLAADPDLSAHLEFPIIQPSLDYIIRQNPGHSFELLLYGTDQTDEEHRWRDTLHCAELGAIYLPANWEHGVVTTQTEIISGINPAFYDEAFEKFNALLETLEVSKDQIVYVILAGGIPACNSALLFQGVRHYGDRLQVVYKPEARPPQPIRAGAQLVGAFREAAAIEHLERLDFANALPYMQGTGTQSGLLKLARFGADRLAFNFQAAQTALEAAIELGDRQTRDFVLQNLRHDLNDLLYAGDAQIKWRALVKELYWNLAITYRHRRYADFLGRVYRFQEAALRMMVERTFGLPTDLDDEVKGQNQKLWENGIIANGNLRQHLDNVRLDGGRQLDWTSIGRPTYKAMMSYATGEEPGLDASGEPLIHRNQRGRVQATLKKINALDPLVELRHRTIIGHGFQGVSKEMILEKYHPKDSQGEILTPAAGIAKIAGMLGAEVKKDPYRLLARYLTGRLRKG